MTFAHSSNGTNPRHEEGQNEQGTRNDPLRATDITNEPSRATDIERRPGRLRPGTQHCILCRTETVGACLICHRPLCEQCGQSDDEFLRCPTHHQDEVEALRSTLRQAALAVMGTKRYVDDLVALRNRVLHEVSAALLRSYVERSGGAPSPAQVQQMRRVAFALWNSLAVVADTEDAPVLPGEDEENLRDGEGGLPQGTL